MLIVPAKPFDKIIFNDEYVEDLYEDIEHTSFFPLGRYAIMYILDQFGVTLNDNILCPAYYCNSALEPLVNKNYNITFFDIKRDFSIDAGKLISEIEKKNSKAVILPNYFGIFDTCTKQIYEECKQRGVFVIKDYAHSYLTYLFDSKKQFCDAVILSIRKSVNIQFGGVAIIKNKDTRKNTNSKMALLSKMKFNFGNKVESLLINFGINIYGDAITQIKNLVESAKKIHQNENTDICYNEINGKEIMPLLNKNHYSLEIANLRRSNFEKIHNLLKINTVNLPLISMVESVPQIYPLYGDLDLCLYLRNNGVGATMWPYNDIPSKIELYPNSEYFQKHIVCLPIHQEVSEKHINKMSELINEYRKTK